MNPIIHAGVGWLIAQPLARRRDRIAITVLAVAPDLDGLGIIVSEDLYAEWHHRLAHGAVAAVIATAVGAAVCQRRLLGAALGLAAFHSHILMDLCGSGPGWPILYFWPWRDTEWLPSWQWDLASWQNSLFGALTIALCLAMGVRRGHTPVEIVSERADRAVVSTLQKRFARKKTTS